ncbi:MAG: hypothetical protein ACFFDC_15550, partial [Promethearchaeota archaeon]
SEFLRKYYEYSTLYITLLSDTAEEFNNLILTGEVTKDWHSSDFKDNENHKFIKELLTPPKKPFSFSINRIEDKQLSQVYNQLKQTFYQKFRENLTSARSQSAIARAVIGTELLLERRPLTQEEIEKATKFQRSTISDTLKLLLNMKMVQLVKKPGDRKKYYVIIQSWDTRTLNRIRTNIGYALEMQKKNSYFYEITNQITTDKDVKSLLVFFQHVRQSYEQFKQYFKLIEVKFLNIRLKEYLAQRTNL